MSPLYVLGALFLTVFFNAIGWTFLALVWAAAAIASFVQVLRDEYGNGEGDEP